MINYFPTIPASQIALYRDPDIVSSKYVTMIVIRPKMNNPVAQAIHAIISYPFGVKLVNIFGINKTTTEATNKNLPNPIPILELFCL